MTMKNGIGFIQDFRGIAALSVVLFHASNFISPYGQGLGGLLFGPSGTMGVDLFFIISGFIMVYATRSSDGTAKYTREFLTRRFSRVFPLYAITTLIYYVLCQHYEVPGNLSGSDLISSLLFMPIGGDYGPVYGWPVLGVGWTLNYEIYFYLIFGLTLLLGRMKWLALAVWFAFTIYFLPGLTGREFNILPAIHYHYPVEYLNLITNPVIILFLSGAAIGYIYLSRFRLHFVPSVIVAVTSSLFFGWQYSTHYNVDHGATQWGLSLIPLVLAFAVASKSIQIPTSRVTQYLGEISFSLYLTHPMVMMFYHKFMGWAGLAGVSLGFPGIAVVLLGSIAVAAVFNRYVEIRFSDWFRDALLGRRRTTRKNLAAAKVVNPS